MKKIGRISFRIKTKESKLEEYKIVLVQNKTEKKSSHQFRREPKRLVKFRVNPARKKQRKSKKIFRLIRRIA